jgi:hypothetical protein
VKHPLQIGVETRVDHARKPHLPQNRSAKKPGRINLRAVSEVLQDRGLDPTEELVNIIAPLDENGEPKASELDAEVRARILNELLQYTQPKLKSVEIRAKVVGTSFDVNDEQARRIAEEFLKSAGESTE